MSESDTCEHHGAQVAVGIHEVEHAAAGDVCAWCGHEPAVLLQKNERHNLLLCEECSRVIKVLGSDQP